jgi:hypothetical protein
MYSLPVSRRTPESKSQNVKSEFRSTSCWSCIEVRVRVRTRCEAAAAPSGFALLALRASAQVFGKSFPVNDYEFLDLRTQSPARVVANYLLPNNSRSPYIIVDHGAMFVNGALSVMIGNNLRGDMLTACDAIAAFLRVTPNAMPIAMLRCYDWKTYLLSLSAAKWGLLLTICGRCMSRTASASYPIYKREAGTWAH